MAFTPITSPQAGFTPLDEVAASRVKPPMTLEQLIAEKNAGTFPEQSQPFAAFSRGALESALAGTTEAAGSLAGANPASDPSSPQMTNPALYSTGEIVGNLIPIGRIKAAGTGLWNAVKEGARLGLTYGAGQGVSKVARSEEPTVSGAVEAGLTEGTKGAALGGVIPLAAGSAVKLIPTKQNILDDLTKISAGDEGKLQRSVSGGYVQAAEKITPFLKKDTGVPGFLDATQKALEQEGNAFRPIIEKADPSQLNPDQIYSQVDDELAKLIPNADTRRDLLLNSGDFLSDLTQITPKNFLQYASKANREIGRIYKNPSTPITADGLAAKEAIRDVYGNTIRKILEDAGEDPSVYSGYGAIKELSSSIGKNYLQQSYKLSAQEARSVPQNILSGLEAGGGGLNVGRAIESTLAPITGGEKGRLDRQLNSLVNGFLGFKREATNAGKAEKLDAALKALNSLNKNQADPLTTVDEVSKKVSGR